MQCLSSFLFFFFFNDTATTEIYTLSLHDALPICFMNFAPRVMITSADLAATGLVQPASRIRSEEHTSELQSQSNLVCRLLLEKKKKKYRQTAACHRTAVPPSHGAVWHSSVRHRGS